LYLSALLAVQALVEGVYSLFVQAAVFRHRTKQLRLRRDHHLIQAAILRLMIPPGMMLQAPMVQMINPLPDNRAPHLPIWIILRIR